MRKDIYINKVWDHTFRRKCNEGSFLQSLNRYLFSKEKNPSNNLFGDVFLFISACAEFSFSPLFCSLVCNQYLFILSSFLSSHQSCLPPVLSDCFLCSPMFLLISFLSFAVILLPLKCCIRCPHL